MTSAALLDVRSEHRSNVFLAAVMQVGRSTFPVRIRNLSAAGALVDGKELPNEGDVVRLQRGPHSVVATVLRRAASSCGLSFASVVPVKEWISYGSGHKGQQAVDEIVAGVRTAMATPTLAEVTRQPPPIGAAQVQEQIEAVAEQLQDLSLAFAAIPGVIDQGIAALQALDIARQKLVDLSAAVRAGGP